MKIRAKFKELISLLAPSLSSSCVVMFNIKPFSTNDTLHQRSDLKSSGTHGYSNISVVANAVKEHLLFNQQRRVFNIPPIITNYADNPDLFLQ